jgi:hypothetical protein
MFISILMEQNSSLLLYTDFTTDDNQIQEKISYFHERRTIGRGRDSHFFECLNSLYLNITKRNNLLKLSKLLKASNMKTIICKNLKR